MTEQTDGAPYSALAQAIVRESMDRMEFLRKVNLDLTDKQSNQQLTDWALAIDRLLALKGE